MRAWLAGTVPDRPIAKAAAAATPASAFFDDFNSPHLAPLVHLKRLGQRTPSELHLAPPEFLRVRGGVLQIALTKERNPLRDYRCGEVRTRKALGYGLYEARIRAASGSGLNSAMFTYSGKPLTPVHDEIDFESSAAIRRTRTWHISGTVLATRKK